MSCALLWLEAPLQSWGHDSRYGRRATLPFPTRSGIMGLLCCAMGRGGEQRQWLAQMRSMPLAIAAYARKDAGFTPQLRDFHMVGSGYDKNDSWQDLMILKRSDGSRPSNSPGTRLTLRFYLQDMAFAAILALPESLAEEIIQGLKQPVWPICLGRKCCIPADAVWRGEFASFEDAFAKANAIAEAKNRKETLRALEEENPEGEAMILADVPLCFGPYKEYAEREVTVIRTR